MKSNFQNLHLSNKPLEISGTFDLDFTGSNIDNFLGTAKVFNANLLQDSVRLNFDSLTLEQKFNGWKAYCNSKLMNVLFTKELSRKLEGTGVTANCLHPGFVNTGFAGGSTDFVGRARRSSRASRRVAARTRPRRATPMAVGPRGF